MSQSLNGRSFDRGVDLHRVAEFLVRARAQVGHCGFYHLGDWSWNTFLAELRGESPELIRIWESSADAEIAGFAMFYPPGAVDIHSAPWLSNRGTLEIEMLRWAEEVQQIGRAHV